MDERLTTEGLRAAIADEFRAAVEAVAGSTLRVTDAPGATGPGWSAEIAVSGVLDGRLSVWMSDASVQAIAKVMMGLDEPPEPAVASDMLRELFAQTCASLAQKDGFDGLTLTASAPAAGPGGGGPSVAIADADTVVVTLTFDGTVARATPVSTPGGSGHTTGRSPVGATVPAEYAGNLAALLDIELPLVVRFARTEMTLRALSQLGPGSMVDMGRSPDAPVQLLIGTQVIAEGEVVVVAGNYGVRITSLVSPADRLRAMEL